MAVEIGNSTHKFTDEGSTEAKNFVKKLIILWIGQFILKILIKKGTLPDDAGITFLVDIIVGIYIAFIIIKWVNKEIKFFEETEWYKIRKAKQSQVANNYEITEHGKNIIKKLIKGGVFVFLLVFLTQKLSSHGLVKNDLTIFIFTIHLYIGFVVFYLISKKEIIFKQNLKSIPRSRHDPMHSPTTNHTRDIYSSKVSTNNQSSPLFNSNNSSTNQYCKKCYGGLNEKGKCNQCDQKW